MSSRRASCRLARRALRGWASPALLLLLGVAWAPTTAVAGQPPVNACNLEDTEDWINLGPSQRVITFGCPPFPCRFTPSCVKIKPGRTVRWSGEFTFHPLRAGLIVGAVPQNQPNNPIPDLDAGTNSGQITFDDPGAWGFYCNFHFASDAMKGAVFVALFADSFETGNTAEWSFVTP